MRVTLMQVRILLGAFGKKVADVQIRTRGWCRNFESGVGRSSPTAEAAVSRTVLCRFESCLRHAVTAN